MIFEAMLGRTMKIDPEARSSMWEDLQRGRRTEIDYLQASSRNRRSAGAGRAVVAPDRGIDRKAETDGRARRG